MTLLEAFFAAFLGGRETGFVEGRTFAFFGNSLAVVFFFGEGSLVSSSAKRSYLMPTTFISSKALSVFGKSRSCPLRFLSYPTIPYSVPAPCESSERLIILTSCRHL